MKEEEEQNYYDLKQKSHLEFFRFNVKALVIIIVGTAIGYIGSYCWVNNHFFLFCSTIVILLLFRVGLYLKKEMDWYDKIFHIESHKRIINDINNGANS